MTLTNSLYQGITPYPPEIRLILRQAHLGIDLPGLLAHVAIGPAVHEPQAR
ncbi:hypothetical protein ACWEO2_02430 [Nocardia sp. NPDC004278]